MSETIDLSPEEVARLLKSLASVAHGDARIMCERVAHSDYFEISTCVIRRFVAATVEASYAPQLCEAFNALPAVLRTLQAERARAGEQVQPCGHGARFLATGGDEADDDYGCTVYCEECRRVASLEARLATEAGSAFVVGFMRGHERGQENPEETIDETECREMAIEAWQEERHRWPAAVDAGRAVGEEEDEEGSNHGN
jgi:hypothetical protein